MKFSKFSYFKLFVIRTNYYIVLLKHQRNNQESKSLMHHIKNIFFKNKNKKQCLKSDHSSTRRGDFVKKRV